MKSRYESLLERENNKHQREEKKKNKKFHWGVYVLFRLQTNPTQQKNLNNTSLPFLSCKHDFVTLFDGKSFRKNITLVIDDYLNGTNILQVTPSLEVNNSLKLSSPVLRTTPFFCILVVFSRSR